MVKRLPEELLQSLSGVPGFNRSSFEEVHAQEEQITSIRINPLKWGMGVPDFGPSVTCQKVPWSSFGYYLSHRPSFTFDPLFHAGCYYVQEASSMFLEQAFRQCLDLNEPLRVLDLCAAPGGKSTHIQSLVSENSLVVSNEVIRNRAHILSDNLVKWGTSNVIITNNDPSAFQNMGGFFDVLVVDAPCSGSGLFRRDPDAIDEWSLNNVQLCCQRQQRILADALPSLKEGGLLIYSTCSYSRQEDEDITDWLVEEMGMENRELNVDDSWNIVKTTSNKKSAIGYRFYPDKLKGEGFFLSCFRKTTTTSPFKGKPGKQERATIREKEIIGPWLQMEGMSLFRHRELFFALPNFLVNDYNLLQPLLNVVYRGTAVGRIMKDKLVPEHALALSRISSEQVPFLELNITNAIKYLQRQDLDIPFPARGWQVASYNQHALGWINVLPNRINNYYPKELRILKQSNDRSFEK